MLLKLLTKSIHPTNPSKHFQPLLYLSNKHNLTLKLDYTYKTQTPSYPESFKQQSKHLTSYEIYKNKKKQYLDEQKQKRKYKINLAWQQLIQKCDNNTKNLIKQVLEDKRYNKKLLDQLTIVLDYQRHSKLINQYGIGLLVIALNMSNNSQFQNYKQRSVSMFLYVLNNPKNNNIDVSLKNNNNFDSLKNKTSNNTLAIQTIDDLANTKHLNQDVQKIVVLLSQYTFELIKKTSDRSKKPKTKSQYLKFLKKYTKYVHKIQSIYRIIHILCQIQQNNYFMDRFRFSTIAQQLDYKLQKQIIKNQEYLHYKNNSISKSEYFNIYPHTLYIKLFHMFDTYYFQKFASLQFYLDILCAEGFYPRELDHTAKIKNIMSLYRYAYGYTCPKLNKNPFLYQLQQNYYSNPQFAKCLQNYQDIYCIVTFLYMIQSKFYNQYIKLPSILVDNHLAITQLPTIPQLSKFQQQFYKLKQKSILQNSSLKQILYKLYPQITNKQLIQSIIKQKNKPFERIGLATDNQLSLRISQALKNLKINYQKQIFIYNKRVDFLLKNTNIIIQCDGDIHIDFSNNNISVETGWRNMLFLLTGYKIIVIDIYELNKQRSIHQLEQLIIKKLQIMNDHNAYLVQ